MPIVNSHLVTPDLVPLTAARVEIRLMLGATDGVVFDAPIESELFPKVVARPDATGLVSVTLPANSTLTPLNSYYQWSTSIPGETTRVETFIVPNTAGPFWLHDILAVAPAAGDPPSDPFGAAAAAIAAHLAAGDPHNQYYNAARGTAAFDALGAATAAVSTHTGLSDPHSQYATDTDLANHAAAADPHPGYVLESLLDSKGDLYAASADNTPGRLAVGANGTFLEADSTQTLGLKYSTLRGTASPLALAAAAAVGTALLVSREDHVHPWTGLPYDASGAATAAVATHAAVTTSVHGIADTSLLALLGSTVPSALGSASNGSGTEGARANHVHPTTGLGVLANAQTWTLAQSFSAQPVHDAAVALAWGSSGVATPDVFLRRDAANVLAQRNGTTAQALRTYNTYTDASNYERGDIGWNPGGVGANIFGLLQMSAGSGLSRACVVGTGSGSAGNLALVQAGTTRWQVTASGFVAAANNNIWNGTSALATTATAGFLGVNSCAGPPTGVPASIPTGQIPLVWDSTNKKLYAYSGGAWVSSAVFT